MSDFVDSRTEEEILAGRKDFKIYFNPTGTTLERFENKGRYEEIGKLFLGIYHYAKDRQIPDFGDDDAMNIAFDNFKNQEDINIEKYIKTSRKNAENARKNCKDG